MVDFIGAVRDPQFRQGVGQGLVDAAGRGLAMIGGAPVDLTTMFLRPLGYSVPDEQIIGSSEYIGRQMADMGLISQARNPAAEFLSALLIPDPTDIQKLAPYVQRAMNADLVAARPSTPGAAMRAQRGSVGVEPSGLEGYRIKNTPLGKTYRTEKGSISVMENSPYSPRPNSITEFFVDETERGKGVGKKILDDVLSQYDAESVSAAVSSPASLNLFYQKGFRPISNPSASKEEALKMMREDSSVTMVVPPRSQAPREEALRIAQENAAKPVSEGGLGLPPDNTAMDRARAMGFDTPAYRGTTADETNLKPRTFVSENPDVANQYAGYLKDFADDPVMLDAMMKLTPSGNVMPLLVRDADVARSRTNIPDYEMIVDANQSRSRFAAFDPAKRYDPDLLGAADPRLLMLLGLGSGAGLYGLGELYRQKQDNR